jgi:hypothetical protein
MSTAIIKETGSPQKRGLWTALKRALVADDNSVSYVDFVLRRDAKTVHPQAYVIAPADRLVTLYLDVDEWTCNERRYRDFAWGLDEFYWTLQVIIVDEATSVVDSISDVWCFDVDRMTAEYAARPADAAE